MSTASSDPSAVIGALVAMIVVFSLVGIAVYVWDALALSRLFHRLGGESWKGWVPILNTAEVYARGGVPAWSVVFLFIPIVNLYGIYLFVIATYRINVLFGRGAGSTVLAVLLRPVWATLLAWGSTSPDPERGRMQSVPTLSERVGPLLEPAAAPRDASGYAIPPRDAAADAAAAVVGCRRRSRIRDPGRRTGSGPGSRPAAGRARVDRRDHGTAGTGRRDEPVGAARAGRLGVGWCVACHTAPAGSPRSPRSPSASRLRSCRTPRFRPRPHRRRSPRRRCSSSPFRLR